MVLVSKAIKPEGIEVGADFNELPFSQS
ncbi:hypothetical protein FBBAL38_10974 [Flavobacteria bacterium BAL38]|nr:hypothetical protein FBBAL38_10974 [Flavobacteria bacterium BAL38]